MSDDDPRPDDPATKPVVIAGDATQLVLADPDRLVEAFRYLAQWIPGFTQLSTEEERKLTRVAYLDPEFLDAGVRLGRMCGVVRGGEGRRGGGEVERGGPRGLAFAQYFFRLPFDARAEVRAFGLTFDGP